MMPDTICHFVYVSPHLVPLSILQAPLQPTIVPNEAPVTMVEAFQHYSVLYVRYLKVMRKMEDVLDQIVHPQKRKDIRQTLELVSAREGENSIEKRDIIDAVAFFVRVASMSALFFLLFGKTRSGVSRGECV